MEEMDRQRAESGEGTDNTPKLNEYEKVILAAKLARKINNSRIAAREQLAPEELGKLDRRKVTTVAVEQLNSGNIQISRKREEPFEETYDLT